MYVYICICICVCNKSKFPSWLLPQWLGHMMHELPQCHCGDNREATLFSLLHIYQTHLAFVRFEHSVSRGSIMTTNIYLIFIYIFIYNIYIWLYIYI